VTGVGTFATGENFGDGWQAGHWQIGLGIMDANLPDGAIHHVTRLDLRAMDAIGWDLAKTGDFNNDGTVDAVDYSFLRATFGSVVQLAADGNRNGFVDGADYVVWRDNFGVMTTPNPDAAVPESTSTAILLLAVLSICFSRTTR
jgi:hypothetical protein